MTILAELERVAREEFDGHLTIMRFTTNWRVGSARSAVGRD
jgi:hypothetical protein